MLLSDGADSVGAHQKASSLLQSLNLPQHTGMLSVVADFTSVSENVMIF